MAELQLLRVDRADIDVYRDQPFITMYKPMTVRYCTVIKNGSWHNRLKFEIDDFKQITAYLRYL
jgi:hypothetical protein